jgi:predicted nuclease with TOPRIM domain
MKISSFEDADSMESIMSIRQSRLERENLEAHVDLCAERYRVLEEKFTNLEEKVNDSNKRIEENIEVTNGRLEDKLDATSERLEKKIDQISDDMSSMINQNRAGKDNNMRLIAAAAGTVIVGLVSVVVMLMINLQSMTPIVGLG